MTERLSYTEQERRKYIFEKPWKRLQGGWQAGDLKRLTRELRALIPEIREGADDND